MVRVTDVAAHLNISKPSVNKAINILKAQGYVEHEHYGLLSLTDEGKRVAGLVALRHFTIKSFLVDVLNIEPELAEEEACKLEHSMRMETMFKLKEFLENYNRQKPLNEGE